MKKLMTMARQFRDDENGAAMVEYSILIGIITAAVITFIIAVGVYVTNAWSTLCTNLSTDAVNGVGMNCGGAAG
ncbi:Flp family type IVb pilin [Mesorhizobium sp. M2D.F.Ca.ET.223.01.1.1]|nr:Flp family type IVb pilin [Mesorhizobium sp. M2D.F.Ca.ET.223.01.1.1]TGP48360.1 Flp family type IVb pilin [bacterium M00.F.Ca.ET.230.01.1.1]TGR83594.1 Flp family type IVb pilin [Mesorhizobium sp. M2D.F.Ca.ET.223.01.1.1]TGT67582.1 Flp family type IVb pilin [bacterium M00.F.Ca.ET.159.01.1.1]TGT80009.1 Flp family type IVb pilin [bacterium M00.F.Ca.ET.157.01.1.1]